VNRSQLRMPGFFAVTILLVFAGLLFSSSRHTKSQSGNATGTVLINNTQSVEIVGLQRSGGALVAPLKNISQKDLNEYSIGASGHGRVTKDTSTGNRVIAPGESDQVEVIVGSDVPANFIVFAAAFTDGTVEGDAQIVTELKLERAGHKAQLIRMLAAINDTLNSSDAASAAALQRLESRVSSFPPEQQITKPVEVSGLKPAKDRLLREVQSLRDQEREYNGKQVERLVELKTRITKMIASL
jgi:hypothetical protein